MTDYSYVVLGTHMRSQDAHYHHDHHPLKIYGECTATLLYYLFGLTTMKSRPHCVCARCTYSTAYVIQKYLHEGLCHEHTVLHRMYDVLIGVLGEFARI